MSRCGMCEPLCNTKYCVARWRIEALGFSERPDRVASVNRMFVWRSDGFTNGVVKRYRSIVSSIISQFQKKEKAHLTIRMCWISYLCSEKIALCSWQYLFQQFHCAFLCRVVGVQFAAEGSGKVAHPSAPVPEPFFLMSGCFLFPCLVPSFHLCSGQCF